MATIDIYSGSGSGGGGDKEIRDRERLVKEIVKTCESIRKKYRALKTGKLDEDIALEKHFKPITDPLKQIVENTVDEDYSSVVSNVEPMSIIDTNDIVFPKPKKHEAMKIKNQQKRKRSKISSDSPIASTPIKLKRSNILSDSPSHITSNLMETNEIPQSRRRLYEQPSIRPLSIEDVFEDNDESLVSSVRRELQTSEGQETLRSHFGPLGQKYMGAVLGGNKNSNIDYVYGVYFSNNGTMLGDKRIDVDVDDNIIIDGIRYVGTPGLYELIFKRIPDDTAYTEDDKQKYKNILLMTNAHRRDHNMHNPIMGNKGYKYKHIISPLLSNGKIGKGVIVPSTMSLSDNKIDYVHWNDPDELVDRLRLLEASCQAGNNAHDNEILSIIEELREAGLILN